RSDAQPASAQGVSWRLVLPESNRMQALAGTLRLTAADDHAAGTQLVGAAAFVAVLVTLLLVRRASRRPKISGGAPGLVGRVGRWIRSALARPQPAARVAATEVDAVPAPPPPPSFAPL